MSLIGFHRVLISTAILFCGLFSVWLIFGGGGGGEWPRLVVAGGFGLGALGLAIYLIRLNRFLGREPGR